MARLHGGGRTWKVRAGHCHVAFAFVAFDISSLSTAWREPAQKKHAEPGSRRRNFRIRVEQPNHLRDREIDNLSVPVENVVKVPSAEPIVV
jgi:hypothetical protein